MSDNAVGESGNSLQDELLRAWDLDPELDPEKPHGYTGALVNDLPSPTWLDLVTMRGVVFIQSTTPPPRRGRPWQLSDEELVSEERRVRSRRPEATAVDWDANMRAITDAIQAGVPVVFGAQAPAPAAAPTAAPLTSGYMLCEVTTPGLWAAAKTARSVARPWDANLTYNPAAPLVDWKTAKAYLAGCHIHDECLNLKPTFARACWLEARAREAAGEGVEAADASLEFSEMTRVYRRF